MGPSSRVRVWVWTVVGMGGCVLSKYGVSASGPGDVSMRKLRAANPPGYVYPYDLGNGSIVSVSSGVELPSHWGDSGVVVSCGRAATSLDNPMVVVSGAVDGHACENRGDVIQCGQWTLKCGK